MKRSIAILAIFAAVIGFTQSAVAAVVVPGSTYGVYLEGSDSGNAFLVSATFDNIAEAAVRGNQLVTISESQTALSATGSRIDILISAPGDLFPVPDETAFLGIGSNDAFDLAYAVSLDDVRLTLRNIANEIIFASDNLASLATQGTPWDGSFPALLETLGVAGAGGQGVNSIEFNFFVTALSDGSPIPEPGSVMLFGLALLALSVFQRRRR